MTESMLSAIDLSELSDKQLAKEFRAAQKQIKSIDPDVQVWQKLTDLRYFTIGGCLPPLLQALTAKKKYTIVQEKLLGVLDTFVGNPAFSGSQNAGFVTQALKHSLNSIGDLNVFRVLSDMTIYKELMKDTKQNKRIPIEVQPENEIAFLFRLTSLKILYGIVSSQSIPNSADQKLVESIASMPTLASSICLVLENLRIRYNDQITKDGMLQEGIWALSILLFVFRGYPTSLKCLLAGEVLEALRDFAGEESLSLYCLQIFEIISKSSDDALVGIIDEAIVTRVADAILKASEESTHRMDSAFATSTGISAATPGKGKPLAKKEKNTVSIETNSLSTSRVDKLDVFKQTRRQKLACIKVAADTLSAICCKKGSALTLPLISRIMVYFSRVLKDRTVWELAQTPNAEPFDVCLSDVLERCCVFIGSLGLIDGTRRRAACETGALTLLLSVMQNSTAIFNCTIVQPQSVLQSASADESAANAVVKREKGSRGTGSAQRVKIVDHIRPGNCTPREQTEKMKRVRSLQSVVEKSFLSLLGEMTLIQTVSNATSAAIPRRWNSASLYSLDHYLFDVASTNEEDLTCRIDSSILPLLPVAALMELICCTSDRDLGSRGLRVLAAVLGGTDDPTALLKNFNLDATIMGSLSNALQMRMTVLLETFDVNLAGGEKMSSVLDPNNNTNTSFDASHDFFEMKECLEVDVIDSTPFGGIEEPINVPRDLGETVAGHEELSILGDGEVLYVSLIVLESALRMSPVALNTFVTRDRLTLLASLLYKCGATGNNEGSPDHPAAEATSEFEVSLHDLRNYGWCNEGDAIAEKVLLRPILFDIVAFIAASEEAHRVYETETSTQSIPLGYYPVYSSPCREAALTASKLCGDVTVSTLLAQGRYALQLSSRSSSHITAVASGKKELELSVLDAALGCLLSMTKSGPISLYAILESVADADSLPREATSSSRSSSSIDGLREFLINLPSEVTMQTGTNGIGAIDNIADPKACLHSKQVWTRAVYFDQLFMEPTFDSAPSAILSSPSMWPYMTVCAALIGIISDVAAAHNTTSLAIQIIAKLCRIDNVAESAQPVVVDSLATFFISMGGASALAATLGRFGTFPPDSASAEDVIVQRGYAMNFLCYLVNRGRDRELFWQSKIPAASIAHTDPKMQRAAAAKELEKKAKEKNGKDQKKGKSCVKLLDDASIVEEVSWNLESDGSHPDPNRGPKREFWKYLLESQADERHTRSFRSTPLLIALQGGLTLCASELIREGAGVQMSDDHGVTPLMYALLLGDEQSVSALIEAGADVDALDNHGNPVITYGCYSTSPTDLESGLVGPIPLDTVSEITVSVLGKCSMLPLLLAAGVNSRVCSATGDSPILSAMGLGSVSLLIGGFRVTVGSKSYTAGTSPESTLRDVQSLLGHGALINACNHRGVVPLHIAAARGHKELVHVLREYNAIPNAEDSGGYLPIHYVAAACPSNACEMLDYLLDRCKNRPRQRLIFSDARKQDKTNRHADDASRKMSEIFDESSGMTSIRSSRLSEQDLIQSLSDEGMNLVQLCMSARALQLGTFKDLLCGEKLERIALINHVMAKADIDMLSCIDCRGMTVMHACSLLLQGSTAKRILTAAELRSKRVKSYPSVELELLDAIREKGGLMENSECDRAVSLQGFEATSGSSSFSWTPLHGAIAANNPDLVGALLKEGQGQHNLSRHFYVHFLANTEAGPSVCDQIIEECSTSSCYSTLLNSSAPPRWTARPLHLASRARNFHAVTRLLRCSKIDLNVRDEESGMTAVHEACRREDLDALKIFGSMADRLDLLAVDLNGETCIEFAIRTKNAPMLDLLITMRRNDVLENVLRSTDIPSILLQLEVENSSLAKALGFFSPRRQSVEDDAELNIIQAETDIAVAPFMGDFHQEAALVSPMSMAEFQTNDFNSSEDDPETSGTGGITVDLPTSEMLLTSDRILKLLIVAAGEAGIPEEFHSEPCFFGGFLYSEYAVRIN